tara:strand:+ start:1025 stop:1615 length:591 start_codon:yes stop_codon:yes gene_type:complete
MGLKDFFDDIIPNELKGSLGTALGVGTAAYFGYKYSPQIKDAVSGFIGTEGSPGFFGKGGAGNITAPSGVKGFIQKNKDTPLGKFVSGFGKQVAGKAISGGQSPSDSEVMAQRIKTRDYSVPNIPASYNVGSYQATRASVPGFNNPNVNDSLNLMSYFMQDLRDNGRIDSSALYAEAPRGVTIALSSPKTMKMGIG